MSTDLNIPTLNPEYAKRLNRRNDSAYPQIWLVLDKVYDPELPGVTIWDLGILQDVKKTPDGWQIEITLTYSGCPAVGVIKEDIIRALKEAGIDKTVVVKVVLSPAWSTELISPKGKVQLRKHNIAPPMDDESSIPCPICASEDTAIISEFGSTSCKALYRCKDCGEPFDYFKRLQ